LRRAPTQHEHPQGGEQLGEGRALGVLGVLGASLLRSVFLDHDGAVGALVKRVDLDAGLVVHPGDRLVKDGDPAGLDVPGLAEVGFDGARLAEIRVERSRSRP
jgi:hypothetical protein